MGRLAEAVDARTPWELQGWQADWLDAIERPGVGIGCLSVGRGSGKTALVAAVAAEALAPGGVLFKAGTEITAVAASMAGASIILRDVADLLGIGGRNKPGPRSKASPWSYTDSTNKAEIVHRQSNTALRVLGNNPGMAHGRRPRLWLMDEPAQYLVGQGPKMWSAASTALGKVPGAKLLVIGTRPARSDHWYERLLDGGPGIVAHVHKARPDAEPLDRRAWYQGLPGLKAAIPFPELATIEREAAAAALHPNELAAFRALRLNCGVADYEPDDDPLLPPDVWESLPDGEPLPADGRPVVGIDLGESASLSSAVAVWPSGRAEHVAAIGDKPSIEKRGDDDGVGALYRVALNDGELVVAPGRVPAIAALLEKCYQRWGEPAVVVGDRYRDSALRDAMATVGWTCQMIPRGMGGIDGGDDIFRLREAAAMGELAPVSSALLDAAMSRAATTLSPAGNRRMVKPKGRGPRDDPAIALLLAVGEHHRRRHTPEAPPPMLAVGGRVLEL